MENYESLRREFNNYNPDEDPNGEIGMALADAAMKINNNDVKKVQEWAKGVSLEEKVKMERIAKVALINFPTLQRGESIFDSELRKRLYDIRDAGYPVKPYSKMKKKEKWNYLMQIRREIWNKIEKNYPDIAVIIKKENKRRLNEKWING